MLVLGAPVGPIHIEYAKRLEMPDFGCKANPCALMGRVVSQVDAPFSEATSTAFWV